MQINCVKIQKRKGVNYGGKNRDFNQKPSRGRRFDRQSGTGRGKEVAKGGAGGKGTWGDNSKNIARDFEKNNDDDYYFETALNPEKQEKPERQERQERYYKDERRPRRRREDNEEKEGKEEKEGEDVW